VPHDAIYHCKRHDIRVPQDGAIAEFNDLLASAWTVPSPTTIDTPRYRIRYETASLLLEVIAGREPRERRIDLGFKNHPVELYISRKNDTLSISLDSAIKQWRRHAIRVRGGLRTLQQSPLQGWAQLCSRPFFWQNA